MKERIYKFNNSITNNERLKSYIMIGFWISPIIYIILLFLMGLYVVLLKHAIYFIIIALLFLLLSFIIIPMASLVFGIIYYIVDNYYKFHNNSYNITTNYSTITITFNQPYMLPKYNKRVKQIKNEFRIDNIENISKYKLNNKFNYFTMGLNYLFNYKKIGNVCFPSMLSKELILFKLKQPIPFRSFSILSNGRKYSNKYIITDTLVLDIGSTDYITLLHIWNKSKGEE